MYDLPNNTLAIFAVNPAHQAQNISEIPFKKLIPQMKQAFQSVEHTEHSLLQFYFYNHVFHLLRGRYGDYEKVPPDLMSVAQEYLKHTNGVAKRLFFQTLAATHGHLFGFTHSKPNFKEHFEQAYGTDLLNYFLKPTNSFSKNAWLNAIPDVSCGVFVRATLSTFTSVGVGAAKAWADVARLPVDYVLGVTSLETMADQAFSVCHNGGSILNKGHFFTVCTQEMYHLLDVQDSGQIPQWLHNNSNNSVVTPQLKQHVQTICKHFPELREPVNTTLVLASQKKRNAYTAQIAKNAQQFFGNQQQQHHQNQINEKKQQAQQKEAQINTILLGGKMKQ